MKSCKVGGLWHIFRLVILLAVLTLPLHGCAGRGPAKGVSPRQEEAAVSREKESGSAADSLLASARQAEQAGQFRQAEMVLERALRLAPRDAKLWREMALLKLKQDDYGQAEQFCLKSNSLAGDDRELTKKNWGTLEKIYTKLDKTDKVAEARRKAQALE